jgi:putative membrane protein
MYPSSGLALGNVLGAVIYSAIGLLVFVAGFIVLDRLTPQVHIWREISHEKNIALAIFLGAIVIGVALIIASAIHG